MPWKEVSSVSQREQFFNLWQTHRHSVSELCRLFNISRKTGHKWIRRGEEAIGFGDLSRQPKTSPYKTSPDIEKLIVRTRRKHTEWGGRKLKRYLENKGYVDLPSPSTITEILRRHDLLVPRPQNSDSYIRFEHESPNILWQMDFKGHFDTTKNRCYPLTVLDDHSRFNIVLKSCKDERRETVKHGLIDAFERYGLPDRMTMDNGNPWGNKRGGRYTKFTVWLMDQGIRVSHSRPYHPQTQGKDERFHRTLKAEVLKGRHFSNLDECQRAFDNWRDIYNYERPHEALALEVPASRYKVSKRKYNSRVEEYEYEKDDAIRKVDKGGKLSYRNHKFVAGLPFIGKSLAVRRTIKADNYDIYYRHQHIGKLALNSS